MRNFLVVEDLTPQEIEGVFSISQDLETKYKDGVRDALFPGRVLALVFEKQSLRTRVSFQTAMVHLGGSGLFLGEDTGFATTRACQSSMRSVTLVIHAKHSQIFTHSVGMLVDLMGLHSPLWVMEITWLDHLR